ncbi:MAG: hypothetical protein GY786_18220 [Proteobacteria bacterium]|nr:hypothetical protein [Pseudomonadota bacterium]
MRTKKNYFLLSLLLVPLAFVIYQTVGKTVDQPTVPGSSEEMRKKDNPESLEEVTKYKDEYVIFFSGNMVELATRKLFFNQHKNIKYLGEGNFPGVTLVKIESDVEGTLSSLKEKDYIDLIIKNQDGLDCHNSL